jgi:hypothetical protein
MMEITTLETLEEIQEARNLLSLWGVPYGSIREWLDWCPDEESFLLGCFTQWRLVVVSRELEPLGLVVVHECELDGRAVVMLHFWCPAWTSAFVLISAVRAFFSSVRPAVLPVLVYKDECRPIVGLMIRLMRMSLYAGDFYQWVPSEKV